MHISNLYLFSKDTDATEAIRGYKYQELRTLETWIKNKVDGINEQIFCDYEEDIFQRDLSQYKTTFRQVKLYSSKNFSFTSIEVIKGLTHFFMLFVKPEYLFDEPLFIFETNTGIARTYLDNDATLLAEWRDNQESLSDELLVKCIAKVKDIISSYIEDRKKELIASSSNTDLINDATSTFEKLSDDVWAKFVKSIRWRFSETSAEQELENCTSSINSLISLLPFPISNDESDMVFATLQKEVGDRSIQTEPENRLLTSNRLDELLLNLGSESDRIYNEAFSIWKDVTSIEKFSIGEFYEVLHSAKYCRRQLYLKDHSKFWVELLKQYIGIVGVVPMCRREAIYELAWITLRPTLLQKPENSLNGLEPVIEEYFDKMNDFTSTSSMEETLNLLVTCFTTSKFGLIGIGEEKFKSWFENFSSLIDDLIPKSENNNDKCNFLETKGFLLYQKYIIRLEEISKQDIEKPFEEILVLLDQAPLFPVSQLGKRIDSIIEMLISAEVEDDFVTYLEEYSERLLPYVEKRESNYSTGKYHIEKGTGYLHSKRKNNIIKALDSFHKAKDLWLNEETFEGYILALINISQLYSAIGMNMAAKYYSLCGVWAAFNNEDTRLVKRVSDSYSMVFHADFRQGAWISALENLESYILARDHFDAAPLDIDQDEALRKSLIEASVILSLGPEISPQISGYIEYQKTSMGQFYTDFLEDLVNGVKIYRNTKGVNEIIENKLNDSPFSDLGKKRTISWEALGITWKITFTNDFTYNSIAEEFCAVIQIIIVEMALSTNDFCLIKSQVEIELEISNELKEPEHLPSNTQHLWKVSLPVLEPNEKDDISRYYASISSIVWKVLDEISLLPSEEFENTFSSLFEKQSLGSKTLSINSYQRIYRKLRAEDNFNQAQRMNFQPVDYVIKTVENRALSWNESLSFKYDEDQSKKNIELRYKNGNKVIHLTLEKLKQDQRFKELIHLYRSKGWSDWKIVMSLTNVVVDYKSKLSLEHETFTNEEAYFGAVQKRFHEILKLDEGENYVEIPFDLIKDGLEKQFKMLSIQVLKSYGLESKSETPDYIAISEFLNKRFKFDTDDVPEISPLKDI